MINPINKTIIKAFQAFQAIVKVFLIARYEDVNLHKHNKFCPLRVEISNKKVLLPKEDKPNDAQLLIVPKGTTYTVLH